MLDDRPEIELMNRSDPEIELIDEIDDQKIDGKTENRDSFYAPTIMGDLERSGNIVG